MSTSRHKQVKKKQHIVPKCYLANFSDKNGFVWVLHNLHKPIPEQNLFKNKPKNILIEKNFYTLNFQSGKTSFVIEDTLSNIEGVFSTIFREKISKQLRLTDEERAYMSIFIATLWHRTKHSRESFRNSLIDIDRKMNEIKKYIEQNPEAKRYRSHALGGNSVSFTHTELKEGLENFDNIHSQMTLGAVLDIAPIIYQMKWSIFYIDDMYCRFITSDHPVSVMRPEAINKYGCNSHGSAPGLIYKDVEMFVPLSSNAGALLSWKFNKYWYCPIPSDVVDEMNIRTVIHSRNSIVASTSMEFSRLRMLLNQRINK